MRLDGGAPAHLLLSGGGVPGAGSGLEPLNGVNDPWRWWPWYPGWVSDPVDVSWGAGATIPSFAAPTAGSLGVYLAAQGTNAFDIYNDVQPFGVPHANVSVDSITHTVTSRDPSTLATAAAAGEGTAFLLWDFGNADPVTGVGEASITGSPYLGTNADVLPTETRTISDILGTDFTISASAWNEDLIGNPGDFYIDVDTLNYTVDLYGPRTANGWGGPPAARLGGVLVSPDGTQYRLVVADNGDLSTEPA